MKSAFIVSFTIVFVGLGLNLILSQIVFNGEQIHRLMQNH